MGHKEFGILYISDKNINEVKPRNFGGDMIEVVLENEFKFKEYNEKCEGGTLNAEGIYGLRKSN